MPSEPTPQVWPRAQEQSRARRLRRGNGATRSRDGEHGEYPPLDRSEHGARLAVGSEGVSCFPPLQPPPHGGGVGVVGCPSGVWGCGPTIPLSARAPGTRRGQRPQYRTVA